MDEFTEARYNRAVESYIDVLLTLGLLEASSVLREHCVTLDINEVNKRVTARLEEMGLRVKGELHE